MTVAKWRPSNAGTTGRIPLIAWGHAKFNTNVRGKPAGYSKRCRSLLKQQEQCGRIVVVPIDEFNTSQVCSSCRQKTLRKVRVEGDMGGELNSVLSCSHCNKIWQR